MGTFCKAGARARQARHGRRARDAARAWQRSWPDGWYRSIWVDRCPGSVLEADRAVVIDIRQYLLCIGRLPRPDAHNATTWSALLPDAASAAKRLALHGMCCCDARRWRRCDKEPRQLNCFKRRNDICPPLPYRAAWVWTDGSADARTCSEGAGVYGE